MSTYEDYGRAAGDYDSSRVALGTEIVVDAMETQGIDPATAHVLDAGCGTGGYAAAVAPHVGSMTLVDANPEMLATAGAKFADDPSVDLCQSALADLPFEDDTFDAVMVNQVLHHLGDEEGGAWEHHGTAIAELSRVLRRGGVLTVNTCSQAQLDRGYWYYALIPEAADALRRRYAPLAALEALFGAAGLAPRERVVPKGEPLQGDSYLDGRSPLDETWRNGDSAWQLTSAGELDAAEHQVESLDERGALDAFVAEHDSDRADIGQITFLVAAQP